MNRFKTPVVVWKTFKYRCEVCGNVYDMHLQLGVEGPSTNHIPSPFSFNCFNGCEGFCPVMHVQWDKDKELPKPREAKEDEYVFLFYTETGHGMPVRITKKWAAQKTDGEIIILE